MLSGASATFVLTLGHIADPVQSILDAPVATIDLKQFCSFGLLGGQARDCVGNFGRLLTINDSRPLDSNRLSEAWSLTIAY